MENNLTYSLTRAELAQAYGVSRMTFYVWLRNGENEILTHNRKYLPAEIEKIFKNFGKPPYLERVLKEKPEKTRKNPKKL